LTSPAHAIGYSPSDFEFENAFEQATSARYMYDVSANGLFTFSFQQSSSQASEVASLVPFWNDASAYLPATTDQISAPLPSVSDIASSRTGLYIDNSAEIGNLRVFYDNPHAQTSQLTSLISHHDPSFLPLQQNPVPSASPPTTQKNAEGKYYCTLCTTNQTWKWLSGWK
jgi:hypothetical protein